jgi:hypothetical protein
MKTNAIKVVAVAMTAGALAAYAVCRPRAGRGYTKCRHITVAAATSGPAPGFIGDPNWNLKDGIFSTSVEDGNPFAENVTTNAAGAVTAVNFGIPAGNSNLLNPVVGGHQY